MHLTEEVRSAILPSEHGLFANCHASTIVALDSGPLLAAYFAGTREGAGDTAIWLSRRQNGLWQDPVRLFAEHGLAHWNPVLHANGECVWLFYKVGPSVHDWSSRMAISRDGGQTWEASRPVVAEDRSPRGPVKNKLLVLTDGTWLAPASIETATVWDAFVDVSNDDGLTWHARFVPLEHQHGDSTLSAALWTGLAENALWETDLQRVSAWDGVIQPTLWESTAGHVHMLLRSTRGWVYRSDSDDNGTTWSAAYPTILPNNNSGLDLARVANGTLILAYNPITGNWGRRTPLSLAASTDNGESWTALRDLSAGEGEFSYPAVISVGARLHVTYTWNRKNIIHHEFQLNNPP